MSVTVVTQAETTALTLLDTVQAELGLAVGTDTDLLLNLIERASSAIARETRRTFGIETVTETMDGSGTRLLSLSRTPVLDITEVTEDSVVLDTTEYSLEDAEAGALYRLNGWGRTLGLRMWGTEAFASGYILPGYRDLRYSVTYRAGYVLPPERNAFLLNGADDAQDLPGAVEQACLETVKTWYLVRKTGAEQASGPIAQVQIGPVMTRYARPAVLPGTVLTGSLPAAALGLLRNYYAMTAVLP